MKIICSTNMPFAMEAFSTLGETTILQERTITAEDVRDADILAIRSTTKVNADLLDGSSVKFAGTATIGVNHMDAAYLEDKGITWCAAPGCNANSVSEYITRALLTVAERHGFELKGKTLGVIGVGNVGSRVVQKALSLGMNVLPNDPPRAERAEEVISHQSSVISPLAFVDIDQVLAEADIITMHVPLTKDGPHPTYHLADRAFFDKAKPGLFFINSSRGGANDTAAVLEAMESGKIARAVIDVWEGEPGFSRELMQKVELGTPHIAGHSFEGKVMGTVMVYRAACKHLGIEPSWDHEPHMPLPPVPEIEFDQGDMTDQAALNEITGRVYDITSDDKILRDVIDKPDDDRAKVFDAYRRNYPMRREFRFTTVKLTNATDTLRETLEAIGFVVA